MRHRFATARDRRHYHNLKFLLRERQLNLAQWRAGVCFVDHLGDHMQGFPVLGIAFLIMLTLKLFGVAAISWWVVTAPLWAPLAVGPAIMALTFLGVGSFVGIAALFGGKKIKTAGLR